MTEYDRTNTGALFEPRYQKLIRYGRINIEGQEDSYSIVQVQTKSGKTVYELHKRVGVLFTNAKQREGKRDPDTYGKLEAPQSHVLYNISGWRKVGKNEESFTSLSIRPAQLDEKDESQDDELPPF